MRPVKSVPSSVLVGIAVALIVSPPFVGIASASCESDCDDAQAEAVDACYDAWNAGNTACWEPWIAAMNEADAAYDGDMDQCDIDATLRETICQNDYDLAMTIAGTTAQACSATAVATWANEILLCPLDPNPVQCLARATTTQNNSLAACLFTLQSATTIADATRNNCLANSDATTTACYATAGSARDAIEAAAESAYQVCHLTLETNLGKCLADAEDAYDDCIAACDG